MTFQRRSLVTLLAQYIPDTIQRNYVINRLLDNQTSLKVQGAQEYLALFKSRLPANVQPRLLRDLDSAMREYVRSTNAREDLAG